LKCPKKDIVGTGPSLKGTGPRKLFHTKETLKEVGAKGMTITTFPTLEKEEIYYDVQLHESAQWITTINDEVMHELISKVSGAIEIYFEKAEYMAVEPRDVLTVLWLLKLVGRIHITIMNRCEEQKEDLKEELNKMSLR
jgi:hypothetical protein